MSFPLFTNLLSESQCKDITNLQKNSLITSIKKLDQDGINCMYALIIAYNLNENKKSSLSEIDLSNEAYIYPYCSKMISSDEVEIDVDELPKKLKQILYKFSILHQKRMKEDKKLRK